MRLENLGALERERERGVFNQQVNYQAEKSSNLEEIIKKKINRMYKRELCKNVARHKR